MEELLPYLHFVVLPQVIDALITYYRTRKLEGDQGSAGVPAAPA